MIKINYDERVIIEKDYICVSASTKMLWKKLSEEVTFKQRWQTGPGSWEDSEDGTEAEGDALSS